MSSIWTPRRSSTLGISVILAAASAMTACASASESVDLAAGAAEETYSVASALAQWFDATRGEIVESGWDFGDTNEVGWAQAGRAAQGICQKRGFVGGFFNGHQIPPKYGIICVGAGAQWFDATRVEIVESGWDFSDTNEVGWAQAGRAAQGLCQKRGFVGGFFNGHQTPPKYGLVCVR
jgi:hypothetical protein